MRRWRRAWVPALRMARRDALRSRGRSVLIIVMIALPVAAVVAVDVVARTADVSTVESLDRHLGHADAVVRTDGSNVPVTQSPLDDGFSSEAVEPGDTPLPAATARTIAAALPGARVMELREGTVAVRTDVGTSRPEAVEIDLRKPMTAGLYHLTSGRLPKADDEILVSRRLARRGFLPGALVSYADGGRAQVVGLVASATSRDPNLLVGLPGALPLGDPAPPGAAPPRTWLVQAPGGVSWAQVKTLNTLGMTALSRQVVENPPPASQVPGDVRTQVSGTSAADVAVIAMIVAMALLEVVLLAGPAFAVGVKRQERALALFAATGGEPPDIRKVVLSSGVVLGVTAGVLGAVGGVAAAAAGLPIVQTFSSERFGPFQVVPRDVLVIAVAGVLSALLAALAPAIMASRQDVVAVLAGRRGQTRRPIWSPLLGTVLLGLGITGAVMGAKRSVGGDFLIAGAAVLSVLGMVLLIPLVVSQLGRTAGRLPLPLRFAVRDASRQRARTAPAVAAVAAVVAGVVALGVGGSSDAAQARATYQPSAPMGAAVVSWCCGRTEWSQVAGGWTTLERAVRQQAPAATVHRMQGVPDEVQIGAKPDDPTRSLDVAAGPSDITMSYSASYGSLFLVGRDTLDAMRLGLSRADRARATQVLAHGGVVLLAQRSTGLSTAVLKAMDQPADGSEPVEAGHWTVPATTVRVTGGVAPARAVLSAAAAAATGMPVGTTSLLLTGTTIGQAQQDRITEAAQQVADRAGVIVERGYHDNTVAVALLILGFAGAVLVLGGTLTATFLALSDARPDFATMGAVGAGPRTRRMVAAAYAFTVGVVGAVLGAAVGFIPGIAVTYPLTSTRFESATTDAAGIPLPSHFLDVPWLLILGLVVGLPLFAALVVAASTRSRLPMVSRLS